MMRTDDIRVFVLAAETGSFSAAARHLEITPALASSCVQRLERALAGRLFVRSTRRMRLSDEGERFLPHARAMLNAEGEGRLALARGRQTITGTLRLSAPSDLGRNVLLPWLDDFQRRHPQVSLQVHISDRIADFFQQPLDVGIRYGQLADSALVSLPLAPANRRTLCAAPAYLKQHGAPAAPEDLRHHNCLRFVMGEITHERWTFHLPKGVQTVTVSGNRVSDDADVVRRWGLNGFGLLYKSRLDVKADLLAGRLVEVFPPEHGEPAPLHLVSAHRSSITPVVQRLRTHLRQRCTALEKS